MARQSGTIGPMADVDLVVNCFERTYREVLDGDLLNTIADANRFAFASRTVLINNVDDRADAQRRAQAAIDRGAIDRFAFVADHLDGALEATGLTRADLRRVPHYTDAPLVAVTLEGAPWLAYWDADIHLREPVDWITPSIELMDRDPRVLAANPNWVDPTLDREAVGQAGDFTLSQGFSDQLFLARRADLARPIYGQRCLALYRYPLSHVADVFEARVDAHMRHAGFLRATYRPATYVHPAAGAGASYPAHSPAERVRGAWHKGVVAVLRVSPLRPRCCRTL
jgi:hypothetical protein